MTVTLTQDVAEHKYPYLDVSLIEGTGRASNVYTFQAPFRNGIANHPNLFPSGWRDFLAACADKKGGKLLHPEFGVVNVKCKSVKTSWDPMKRDGVDVDVEFIETRIKADEDILMFNQGSPAASAMASAYDFDSAITDGGFTVEYPESLKPDLLSAIKQLNGLMSQISLGLGNIGAQFDAVLGDIDGLIQTLQGKNNPALAAAIAALTSTYASVMAMAQSITSKSRDVSMAVVTRDSNLSAAAGALGQKTDEFLKLNPALGTQTRITAGTQVLIYI